MDKIIVLIQVTYYFKEEHLHNKLTMEEIINKFKIKIKIKKITLIRIKLIIINRKKR
jgi:hypothetical protein